MKNLFNKLRAAFSTIKAHAVRSFSADPLMGYKFRVSISGIPDSIGFQKISGMSREVEVVEYLENMFEYAHKFPGREKVGEVTFERGMYGGDETLWNAYKSIFKESTAVRRDVTLNVCDRWGNIRRTFQLAECWFSKFETGDYDASNSEVVIETLTMQFENYL